MTLLSLELLATSMLTNSSSKWLNVATILTMRISTSERLSHYETLGVGRNATEKQIKVAYKKLAISLHPDKVRRSHL